MNGAELRFFAVDVAVADQRRQGIFQSERTFFLGDRNFLMQMLQRIAADAVARAIADHEELRSRHAAAALFWQQDLRVNGGDRHAEVLANGILPLQWERISDPGDRGRDVGGMQRGEHEMAGLGGSYRDAHGFGVAHLADYDDIWSLTQRRA